MSAPLDLPGLRGRLCEQGGVVTRAHLMMHGATPAQLRVWLARRDVCAVHPGVYVTHPGAPTWHERAWAAVLATWPAALHGVSALRAADGPGRRSHDEAGPVHVVVDRNRRAVAPDRVVLHRADRLGEAQVQWRAGPPRQRYEEASLTVALAAPDRLTGLAVLAAGIHGRRTVAYRLRDNLDSRPTVPDRDFWGRVLDDLAAGTCSVLEHEYLERVERPHGLPTAARRVRSDASTGLVHRGGEHAEGLVVELDGRLDHDATEGRGRDLDPGLEPALERRSGVRLSWGQVLDRPCATAARIGRLLRLDGWRGTPRPCGPGCAVADAEAA